MKIGLFRKTKSQIRNNHSVSSLSVPDLRTAILRERLVALRYKSFRRNSKYNDHQYSHLQCIENFLECYIRRAKRKPKTIVNLPHDSKHQALDLKAIFYFF